MFDTHDTALTRYIEAGGYKYAYRTFGKPQGSPLVFLQHFRGGLDHWDPTITDGLAKTRRVILFNNAGVASSSGQPADTVGGMAKHVMAFIQALGLKEVDLLGFSLGGFVAQQILIDSPDLIRRAILAGTGPQGGEGMQSFTPDVVEHATHETPSREDFLYLFFAPSVTSQKLGRLFWERRHQRNAQDIPSSMNALYAQLNAIGHWGVIPKKDRYIQLAKIRQPILVVNGQNDIMIPSINSVILQQHLPDATLIIYPDSGHGAIFQYPDRFVAHAELFLEK
jgi:pimeloyl-ACP methyl ester carboxylesterase